MTTHKEFENIELLNVDQDLKDIFLKLGHTCYRPGLPTEIQTSRLLARINNNIEELINVLKVSDGYPCACGNSQNDI